jgi:hypothetical protein
VVRHLWWEPCGWCLWIALGACSEAASWSEGLLAVAMNDSSFYPFIVWCLSACLCADLPAYANSNSSSMQWSLPFAQDARCSSAQLNFRRSKLLVSDAQHCVVQHACRKIGVSWCRCSAPGGRLDESLHAWLGLMRVLLESSLDVLHNIYITII